MGKLEKVLTLGTDIIFGLLYVGVIYSTFTTENNAIEGVGWIVFIIGLGFVAILHKIIKVILGTIARAFDGTVGKIGNNKSETDK